MSDKHVFFSLIGSFFFFAVILLAGGTLGRLVKFDSGDDGIGLIFIACAVIAGIMGFVVTARWLQKRSETQN